MFFTSMILKALIYGREYYSDNLRRKTDKWLSATLK